MLKLINTLFGSKEKLDIDVFNETLKYVHDHELYPDIRIFNSAVEPESIIDGKKVLMFASNNYLGLANNPLVKQGAIKAINKYGVGSTGSRLLTGNIDIHVELEKKLADFKGGEDSIVFPTGFGANTGTISGLMNPFKVNVAAYLGKKSVILSDELNHASIIDGIRLSDQIKEIYRHCDISHLEFLLKKYKNRRKIIVTDSVFSMDGDIAPLDKISKLAKKYNAMTMIDEAHAVGVIGKNGGGAMEHFNLKVTEDITIVMGTLSKAIGCSGGYIVGSKDLIKYLRITGRSYMFSTAMLPAVSGGALASIDLIINDKTLQNNLWDNINYMKSGFEKLNFKLIKSESAIIPLLIGEDLEAISISRKFFDNGIYAPCVRWPVVPRGQSRIRFTVTALHTKEHIDRLLEVASKIINNTHLSA